MRPDKKGFLTVVTLILFTRALDGLTTYIASPDLRAEANPLVRNMHFGWLGLMLSVSILTLVIIYFAYLYYMKPLSYKQLPGHALASPLSFALFISYGPKGKFSDFLYRIPSLPIAGRLIGYATALTMIIFGIYLIINNTLFLFDKYPIAIAWVKFGGESRTTHLIIIAITFLAGCVLFYRKEYEKALLFASGRAEKKQLS